MEGNGSIFLGGEGWPMISLETDHVISGPMRDLKMNSIWIRQHTYNIYKYIATTRLTRPGGPSQWKHFTSLIDSIDMIFVSGPKILKFCYLFCYALHQASTLKMKLWHVHFTCNIPHLAPLNQKGSPKRDDHWTK